MGALAFLCVSFCLASFWSWLPSSGLVSLIFSHASLVVCWLIAVHSLPGPGSFLLSYLVFFLQRPWGLEGCACSCEQPSSWGSELGLSFGLWVREQGEFRQWYHNCFMVQRGVGCAPQDLRSGTRTVLEGMLWEGKDSENLCLPCELVGSECLEPLWFVAGDIVVISVSLGWSCAVC